jgi:hypothetical protein
MARPVVVTILGTLAACSGGGQKPLPGNPPMPTTQPAPDQDDETAEGDEEEGIPEAGADDGAAEETSGDTPGAPEPPGDLTRFTRVLNPQHAEHGRIYRGSDATCYVRLPFPEGQGPPVSFRPPPTEPVDCPEVLADASWESCVHGTVLADADATECRCTVLGNPPPPPRLIPCPKHEG